MGQIYSQGYVKDENRDSEILDTSEISVRDKFVNNIPRASAGAAAVAAGDPASAAAPASASAAAPAAAPAGDPASAGAPTRTATVGAPTDVYIPGELNKIVFDNTSSSVYKFTLDGKDLTNEDIIKLIKTLRTTKNFNFSNIKTLSSIDEKFKSFFYKTRNIIFESGSIQFKSSSPDYVIDINNTKELNEFLSHINKVLEYLKNPSATPKVSPSSGTKIKANTIKVLNQSEHDYLFDTVFTKGSNLSGTYTPGEFKKRGNKVEDKDISKNIIDSLIKYVKYKAPKTKQKSGKEYPDIKKYIESDLNIKDNTLKTTYEDYFNSSYKTLSDKIKIQKFKRWVATGAEYHTPDFTDITDEQKYFTFELFGKILEDYKKNVDKTFSGGARTKQTKKFRKSIKNQSYKQKSKRLMIQTKKNRSKSKLSFNKTKRRSY